MLRDRSALALATSSYHLFLTTKLGMDLIKFDNDNVTYTKLWKILGVGYMLRTWDLTESGYFVAVRCSFEYAAGFSAPQGQALDML
ncbi:hypothetical protein N0V90_007900 [Kalmusia sp. IMI 367209]|nr:hypothetical protein N0V90_007900 [Kalmusia sp. IMI 367209]